MSSVGGGWGVDARAAATSSQPNETEQNCISSSPLHAISVCHFPLFTFEVLVYSQLLLTCISYINTHLLPIWAFVPCSRMDCTSPLPDSVPYPIVWHHVSPDDAGLLELYCVNAHGRSSSALGSGTSKH